MSTLQHRKKGESDSPFDTSIHASSSKTRKPAAQRGGIVKSLLVLLFGSLLLAAATSYIVTDSLTFGKPLPNWRKYNPFQKERVFTEEELLQYDGTDPNKPVYIALLGNVYDVTAGRNHYKKGSTYGAFAGRDAARAFITGCFQTHLTHDLRGLTEDELKGIDHWVKFYANHKKYFRVGTVIHDPIDPNSPIPEHCIQPPSS